MEQEDVKRITTHVTFSAQLIIANVWVMGAWLVKPEHTNTLICIGLGWVVLAVVNKLIGK